MGTLVRLKKMKYGDLIILYPKPYSIYLRGTIVFGVYFGFEDNGESDGQ